MARSYSTTSHHAFRLTISYENNALPLQYQTSICQFTSVNQRMCHLFQTRQPKSFRTFKAKKKPPTHTGRQTCSVPTVEGPPLACLLNDGYTGHGCSAAAVPEENFFDLGGHSALAAKMAAELSGEYSLPVTVGGTRFLFIKQLVFWRGSWDLLVALMFGQISLHRRNPKK